MNQLDLTKQCAVCGGQLQYAAKYDPRLLPDFSLNTNREMVEDDLDEMVSFCPCMDKNTRGNCGNCRSCRVADMGCACDGAYDAGCFFCTPTEFERPPCPTASTAPSSTDAGNY